MPQHSKEGREEGCGSRPVKCNLLIEEACQRYHPIFVPWTLVQLFCEEKPALLEETSVAEGDSHASPTNRGNRGNDPYTPAKLYIIIEEPMKK
jgi:hypothetical protein